MQANCKCKMLSVSVLSGVWDFGFLPEILRKRGSGCLFGRHSFPLPATSVCVLSFLLSARSAGFPNSAGVSISIYNALNTPLYDFNSS